MGKIKTMQSFVMKRFTILNTMILDSNDTTFTRLAQLKEITQTLYITMVLVTAHSLIRSIFDNLEKLLLGVPHLLSNRDCITCLRRFL